MEKDVMEKPVETAQEPKKKESSKSGKKPKKGFLPGMAPANSKALDRMGEVYYTKLREWQLLGEELEGLKAEILARMKVEKIKKYKTPDGVEMESKASTKLKVKKEQPK
jgi:hypothetical protein